MEKQLKNTMKRLTLTIIIPTLCLLLTHCSNLTVFGQQNVISVNLAAGISEVVA